MMLNQSRLGHLTMLVVIASVVVVLCAPRAAARRVEPLRLNADQPQLFIDDYLIDEKKGLKRTLHQPDDVPANPVILPEHPWEHRRIPYGSVWYDAELFVVTKPLVAVGKQLHLNVAVHDGGHAKVALLDEDGMPLPGFDLANSRPITSDGLDQLVSWNSGSDISKLAGETIRVRIDLSDARLYALEFRKVPSPRDSKRASSGDTP